MQTLQTAWIKACRVHWVNQQEMMGLYVHLKGLYTSNRLKLEEEDWMIRVAWPVERG